MGDPCCKECGRSMRIDKTTIKGGDYCSEGCKQKAWRREHTHTCKICGKEFVADTGIFGPKANGYCSEECQRKAHLQTEKPRAEKTLEKWKKELEKSQKKYRARIDKLAAAIRSDDPEAMLAARKGNSLKRACGCLFVVLQVIALLIFLVGLANVILFFRDVVSHPRTKNVAAETTSETGVPAPQDEKQEEAKPSATPDSTVTTQDVSTAVPTPAE